ncbi:MULTISPECIES: hypothetical protein [unclassified Yoonia]|uniref:hypothetical protein n=1 Tax=unclassified Yoonia TaxID=2629118 RepID=UPI002AFFA99D|nr:MULTISPECIES: hypothetical protein [unclassified Yoonia]
MSQATARRLPDMQPDQRLRAAGRKARLTGVTTGNPMQALLAALPAALGRRLRFHELTAVEKSFDEAWLENLLDAVRQGDEARYRFALLSRMSREQASRLHFLICKAAHDTGEAG